MASVPGSPLEGVSRRYQHPFRRAVLRGLGLLLPPLLTILVFVWVGQTIVSNVLVPLENAACEVALTWEYDPLESIPADVPPADVRRDDSGQPVAFARHGETYVPLADGVWIRREVRDTVRQRPGDLALASASARQYYGQYVRVTYLPPYIVLPVFVACFVVVLYLLGKFLAAGVGRILWNFGEGLIHRLPIIRNVYSSVKQVTDFVFSEQELQFKRVVAVEYPRKGTWSIGFVTGESMLDIHVAAGEPVVTVFLPTSPMPATGYTVNVLKSETVDLNITLDQAIQYVVSCGVVIPPHQQPQRVGARASSGNQDPANQDPANQNPANQDPAPGARGRSGTPAVPIWLPQAPSGDGTSPPSSCTPPSKSAPQEV